MHGMEQLRDRVQAALPPQYTAKIEEMCDAESVIVELHDKEHCGLCVLPLEDGTLDFFVWCGCWVGQDRGQTVEEFVRRFADP